MICNPVKKVLPKLRFLRLFTKMDQAKQNGAAHINFLLQNEGFKDVLAL